MISAPIYCRRFIGRGRELSFLGERRRELAKAHGGIILISGEAGIGKSRLIREFLETTQKARGRVGTAHCRPFGSRPYGPILELLEAFAPAARGIAPANSQDAQHRSLADGFIRASEQHALIGVIEDFHWADRGTAAVLALLSEAVATRRILLIVTYRNEELHAEHPLYIPVATLLRSRNAWRIELAALSARETTELIETTLDGHANEVPRQMQRDIANAAEGNPFFMEELLKAAVDRVHANQSDRSLPTTVRAAILQRMEPLNADDRRILTQAAVIGRRFDGDVLAQTLGTTCELLLPTLQRACKFQLVEETCEPNAFRFRHALTREAIYDDLLDAQKRPLHARIALALESLDEEHSVEALAYHWWASGNREKALRYGERAGDIALAVYEFEGAITAYKRTLMLLDASGRDAARVNEKIGTSYYRAGLMDCATEHYAPAWTFFRTTKDDPAYLFRLTRNAAGALYNNGRFSDALSFWGEALAVIVGCGDDRIADLARVTYAAYLVDDGDVDETLAVLACVALTRIDADPELALPFWGVKCVASALIGDRKGLRAAADHLCAINVGRALLGPLNDALGEGGFAALYAGETVVARRLLSAALDNCVTMKSSAMLLADNLFSNAFERSLSGAYEQARAMYQQALAIVGETKVSWYRAWFVALCVGSATHDAALLADEPEAQTIDAAFSTGKPQIYGALAAVYAQVLAARGETDAARRLMRRAVVAAGSAKMSLGSFPLVIDAAQLCEASDAPAVRTLCERDASKGPAPKAAAALADAILTRRFGDPSAAVKGAQDAAVGFAEVGWPFYEALALEEAGQTGAAREIRLRIGQVAPRVQVASEEVGFRGLLTAREVEIAQLVSGGRTNREVAGTLFVSVKLVEKQLSSIYQKLGIRSRSQLTAKFLSPEAASVPSRSPALP